MSKWRKKPVVVEAEVYKPGMEDGFGYRPENIADARENIRFGLPSPLLYPYIATLEGNHFITPGDYIITGVKGERYPCKPDIFHMTYEEVV